MVEATRATAISILGAGVYFFVLQIAGAVAYQSDSLVLAHVIDPRQWHSTQFR